MENKRDARGSGSTGRGRKGEKEEYEGGKIRNLEAKWWKTKFENKKTEQIKIQEMNIF